MSESLLRDLLRFVTTATLNPTLSNVEWVHVVVKHVGLKYIILQLTGDIYDQNVIVTLVGIFLSPVFTSVVGNCHVAGN